MFFDYGYYIYVYIYIQLNYLLHTFGRNQK